LGGNLFDSNPDQTRLFDLVIACEVLEHVAHTTDFLRQLKGFITATGRLLPTTPNGACFRNRLPAYSQMKDLGSLESFQFKPDADGHLFLITPVELMQLAHDAGLAVERLNLWGTPLITGYCNSRQSLVPGLCGLRSTANTVSKPCQPGGANGSVLPCLPCSG
jgi:2-polyprenyl-3-methyl-5-hydroxy-6-metoxy-1,4-benzoquinol methylase